MKAFTTQHTPAEIVNIFPKASDLFKEHEMNFCCQGDKPLHNVFEEKNLDEATLMEELNQRYTRWSENDNQVINWEEKSLSEIVDHLIENYHTDLQEELSLLDQFVTRVYYRHGEDQPHLEELYHAYNYFKANMEEHMLKEEKEWFPLIKEYENNPSEELAERIQQLNLHFEDEHETEIKMLNKIRSITDSFNPPEYACNTYRITYARLAELEENTMQHVHLENNVLLKRVKEQIA